MSKNNKKLNLDKKNYFIPVGISVSRIEVKKSIFIAILSKVNDKSEALTVIKRTKKKYKSSNQCCWAYIIGDPRNPKYININDDSEPRGSAGKPILNILNQNNIGYAIVIVLRFFGGIKLGIGGLVRAYSQITNIAIKKILLRKFIVEKSILAFIPYSYEKIFLYYVNKVGGVIKKVKHKELAIFELLLDKNHCSKFIKKIKDETAGQVTFKIN